MAYGKENPDKKPGEAYSVNKLRDGSQMAIRVGALPKGTRDPYDRPPLCRHQATGQPRGCLRASEWNWLSWMSESAYGSDLEDGFEGGGPISGSACDRDDGQDSIWDGLGMKPGDGWEKSILRTYKKQLWSLSRLSNKVAILCQDVKKLTEESKKDSSSWRNLSPPLQKMWGGSEGRRGSNLDCFLGGSRGGGIPSPNSKTREEAVREVEIASNLIPTDGTWRTVVGKGKGKKKKEGNGAILRDDPVPKTGDTGTKKSQAAGHKGKSKKRGAGGGGGKAAWPSFPSTALGLGGAG